MTTPSTPTTEKFRSANRPSRSLKPITATEAAVRMMSETAHDLRAPLATIRESVRLVQGGDLGKLTQDQQSCLTAAIDQCDCVDQMVGEMIQLERLQTGVPRVRREWIEIQAAQDAINETLKPWVLPRNISVLWDVAEDASQRIFADASMIRRLVVNLVANAIRETPEGGNVLIRVQPVLGKRALQWSVVDHGRGISETEMQEISQRQVSGSGGEGLGLSICRQLSALHFSPLRIESRQGTGTAVSFETIVGGPKAVAESWAQWRISQRSPLRKPISRTQKVSQLTGKIRPARHVRVDAPTIVVELQCEGKKPFVQDRLSAGTVTLGATTPRATAEAFDELLQGQLRMFDFVYRVDTRQWVWLFDANVQQSEDRIDRISDLAKRKIDAVRLSWSDPQIIPLDSRRTASRLTDVLVRQSLSSSSDAIIQSVDAVRLGSEPIQSTPDVESRLDAELARLATRLSNQHRHLDSQAKRMRPGF